MSHSRYILPVSYTQGRLCYNPWKYKAINLKGCCDLHACQSSYDNKVTTGVINGGLRKNQYPTVSLRVFSWWPYQSWIVRAGEPLETQRQLCRQLKDFCKHEAMIWTRLTWLCKCHLYGDDIGNTRKYLVISSQSTYAKMDVSCSAVS